MKIRTDYVSNSSSSSFVLVGKTFDREKVENAIKNNDDKILENLKKKYDYYSKYNAIDDVIEDCGMSDVFELYGLSSKKIGDYEDTDAVLIGKNPSEMKNDETLKEFKEKIIEKLNDFGLSANVTDIEFISGGTDPSGYTFLESCG